MIDNFGWIQLSVVMEFFHGFCDFFEVGLYQFLVYQSCTIGSRVEKPNEKQDFKGVVCGQEE